MLTPEEVRPTQPRIHCSSRGSAQGLTCPLLCLSVCSSWRSPGSSLPHMEMVRDLIHVKHDESVSLKKKRTKDATRRLVPCFWKRVSPCVPTVKAQFLHSFRRHIYTRRSCDKRLTCRWKMSKTCTFLFTVVTPQMSRLYKELEKGPLYHHLCSCLHASHHHHHKGLKEITGHHN